MTHSFVPADDLLDEVTALAMACLSGDVDPEEAEHLDQLLRSSDEACHIYVRVVRDSSNLRQWGSVERPSSKEICDSRKLLALAESDFDEVDRQTDRLSCSDLGSPISVFPSNSLPSLLSNFSESWPVAYLIATVIFGIGAVIGAFTYVSHPVQVARQSASSPQPPAPSPFSNPQSLIPNPSPKAPFVGRITGMVDCKWEKAEGGGRRAEKSLNLQISQTLVSLGDKFKLASGLMEITYDTGAKVILQGPVTYEVESRNGGFLPVGKLTGKVEIETAKGFSIRTPTAVVTDLGTEFAVEVSREGLTETYVNVFDGKVVVAAAASQGRPSSDLHLKAGEAVQIAANEIKRIEFGDAPKRFVRTIRTQYVPSPAPPLTVTDQLCLWLKADAGITTADGNHVAAWADQSGRGHHATTDNGFPELRTKALNGRPVVRFYGIDSLSVAGQVLTSQQFTIVAVVSDASPYDGHREIFSNWSEHFNVQPSVFLGTSTGEARSNRTVRFTGDFYPPKQLSTTAHFVFVALSGANDARILVNGELVAAKGAKLADRNLSTAYYVGYQGAADYAGGAFEFWRGDIAELLVYNKALSTAELHRVHAYLNDKYDLKGQEKPSPIEQKGGGP